MCLNRRDHKICYIITDYITKWKVEKTGSQKLLKAWSTTVTPINITFEL